MKKLSDSEIEAMTYTQCVQEIHSASMYINTLTDHLPSKLGDFIADDWIAKKGLPKEKHPILFQNSDGDWLEGLYVASERMFFLGFKESGEFLFHSDVSDWKYPTREELSNDAKRYKIGQAFIIK